MAFTARLADLLWGPWLLGLFLAVGLVYSIGSGFFQLFGARTWWQATAGSWMGRRRGRRDGLSPLQALATALASTMGTGSIAGVAAAAVSGYLSICLVRMVASKGKFGAFAYYCWAAGAVTIALSVVRTAAGGVVPWAAA